jgi:TusA-related sulfurtransferase
VTTGIANAVGVRRTETCLVVWYGQGAAPLSPAPSAAAVASAPAPTTRGASVYGADAFYDAGSKGCADGPVDEIAVLMRTLSPGQTLEIHATDASLAVDLAAWCRLTGNTLLEQRGSRYLVRRS